MAKGKVQVEFDSSFTYEDESDTSFCKCGAELVPDSESKYYGQRRLRCPNPECKVQCVVMVRPKHHRKTPVRFRDVKFCVVTE